MVIKRKNILIQKSVFLTKKELELLMATSSKGQSTITKDTDEEAGSPRLPFLTKHERQYLIEIPDRFLEDTFNYMKLEEDFKNIKDIYQVINGKRKSQDKVNEKLVYFQLHQRFILSNKGTEKTFTLIYGKVFGACKTKECNNSPLSPYGKSHKSGSNLFVYCSNCNSFYKNKSIEMDGSAYGPDFAHLFNFTFGDTADLSKKISVNKSKYVPRMFGFKVFTGA